MVRTASSVNTDRVTVKAEMRLSTQELTFSDSYLRLRKSYINRSDALNNIFATCITYTVLSSKSLYVLRIVLFYGKSRRSSIRER